MSEQQLVKILLSDYLKHTRLLVCFQAMRFQTINHHIELPETILKIMGLHESETIFLYLIKASELICQNEPAYIDSAEQLFDDLVMMRKEVKI